MTDGISSQPTHRVVLRLLLPLAYTAMIWVLSSIPGGTGPTAPGLLDWLAPWLQNALHVPLFFGLAWTWLWALEPRGMRPAATILAALLLSVGYAALDEWHQGLTPGRYASAADLGRDAIGAVLAAWVWVQFRKRARHPTARRKGPSQGPGIRPGP